MVKAEWYEGGNRVFGLMWAKPCLQKEKPDRDRRALFNSALSPCFLFLEEAFDEVLVVEHDGLC